MDIEKKLEQLEKIIHERRLPAESEMTWKCFELLIKKNLAGYISPENQSELISKMKSFNQDMIKQVAGFTQHNDKHFNRHQKEQIRNNLQELIDFIFFDRMALELDKICLKKMISDQFLESI